MDKKSSERYDLDNTLKTFLDCLQMMGVITNAHRPTESGGNIWHRGDRATICTVILTYIGKSNNILFFLLICLLL